MKTQNKSPTDSTLSERNNFSHNNDDYDDDIIQDDECKDTNKNKNSLPPRKYFIDLDINQQDSILIDDQINTFLRNEEFLHIPPNVSYKSFDFSKKFIESRFIGVDKEISLDQLEKILQFFSIIDKAIEEKPLVLNNILPLCKINDESYDSEKLKESLLDSFKKSLKSSFWSEISNCILSSRMNGKKGFIKRRSAKNDQQQPEKIFKKKKSIQFKYDTNYTSNDYNPEKKKLEERRKYFSDNKNDQNSNKIKDDKKRFNFSDEDENENDDKQFSKLDKILFDEQISNQNEEAISSLDQLLFDTESDGENQNQISNKEKRKKFLFSSHDDKGSLSFLKGEKENKKTKKDHLSTEKVPSPNRKRRKVSKNKSKDSLGDGEDLSEYEYSYYSEEHIEKSKLTFEDLIRQAASKHFESREFQKIAEEEINSKSYSSLESIDYENDEDWFIKTKKRLKHRRKINDNKNRALKEKNINQIMSYQKKQQIKNFPRQKTKGFLK